MGKKKHSKKKVVTSLCDGKDLASLQSDVLRSPQCLHTVGELEQSLLGIFPSSDAESWDRTGLIVGDKTQPIQGIAVALDPTVEALSIACQCGANVLLTHHPVFLDPPENIQPHGPGRYGPGTVVWEAIQRGIALIDIHTALDVSMSAQTVLPSMLNLAFKHVVDPKDDNKNKGYGQLCSPASDGGSLSLQSLAARCVAVFGRMPRVWGSLSTTVQSIVTCTGSCGDLPLKCIDRGYDCLICGEIRYHDALAVSQSGLAVIELGHDVSELPLCALLAATLETLGWDEDSIKVIDQSENWLTPEAIRR